MTKKPRARKPDAAYARRLERAKRASAAQLLFRAARLLNERGVARVRASAPQAEGFRVSHTRLLPHIDMEGTRITEIARRAGISKQAVNQVVGELEAQGAVRRERDPSDARARLVRFTPRGRRGLLHGLGVLRELEDELAARIGRARVERLRADLAVLVDALETDA